jgi:hypothetical protein
MTTFRTYINGLPFEICVDRGLHIEVESNGITVTRCEGEGPKVTSGNVIPFVLARSQKQAQTMGRMATRGR